MKHIYDFDKDEWRPDETPEHAHIPWQINANYEPLDESVEFICRACFLVANRFLSPDGKRCKDCHDDNRSVYERTN